LRVFANRDINAGEEISTRYGGLNIGQPRRSDHGKLASHFLLAFKTAGKGKAIVYLAGQYGMAAFVDQPQRS
jgi:hypothetical protein